MKKLRILAVFLVLLILLGGCNALHEDHDLDGLSLPEMEYVETGTTTRQINPTLYYLSEGGAKLGVETREMTLEQQEDEAQAIVNELLGIPRRSDLRRLGSGLSLDRVVRTGELINVFLYSASALSEEKKFIVSAAVTNTLTDYFGVSYVCVMFNGDPLTIDGYPYGAMQKTSENVRDAYHEYQAKCEALDSLEILLPIYFLDETGQYILPEIRTIQIDKTVENLTEELVNLLLAELSAGPKVRYYLTTSIAQQSTEEDLVQVEHDPALRSLRLHYSYNPTVNGGSVSQQVCASVYFTLSGAIPNVLKLFIDYGNESESISKSIAQTFFGSQIPLYFPNEDKSALVTVYRTVSSENIYRYYTYVRELLRGPLETDPENCVACFPEDMSLSALRYIRIRGNTAYVDFTCELVDAVSKMDEKSEHMLFYAMINTLCSVSRIKQVQFTLEENVVDDAGGNICIRYPLLPNQGLLN